MKIQQVVNQSALGIGPGKIPAPGSRFYLRDNIGPGRSDDTQDDWDAVEAGKFDVAPYRAKEPLTETASGMTPQKSSEALERVLQHAGAIPRDKADARAVEDTRTTSGKHIDTLDQIGGYPAYAAGAAPPDTDNDGIPDAWERAHGLNPNDKSDATKLAPSGYLNVEEYINSLIPMPDAVAKP
ncbi:MAG: thrombospondin type 3 repeat-containing protein [Candidatus Sumerlaeota bacterium]|nr:thrombospondin type 3 repeat-containing protein [Candidatus Sumerlaeota bacterium]